MYARYFHNFIIKLIMSFYGKECVLVVLFQRYGSMAGFFESNLFWVGQYEPLSL